MRNDLTIASLVAALFLALGCGDDTSGGGGSGGSGGSGGTGGTGAGTSDGAGGSGAGITNGGGGSGAGTTDGGGGSGAGTTDGGGGAGGAGGALDGGGGAGGGEPVLLNGCSPDDVETNVTQLEWTFPHQRCISVPVNTTVTWTGDFTFHPLDGGETPTTDATSPITIANPAQGSTSVTFTSAGVYPYFCTIHAASMQGVVYVE